MKRFGALLLLLLLAAASVTQHLSGCPIIIYVSQQKASLITNRLLNFPANDNTTDPRPGTIAARYQQDLRTHSDEEMCR